MLGARLKLCIIDPTDSHTLSRLWNQGFLFLGIPVLMATLTILFTQQFELRRLRRLMIGILVLYTNGGSLSYLYPSITTKVLCFDR